jgi:MFS family permease
MRKDFFEVAKIGNYAVKTNRFRAEIRIFALMNMTKERLATPSYCYILAANFLLYFGFYLVLPVLPFYLREVFAVGSSTAGVVLACYTVAALMVRPFSGYLLDTFARKPLYLLSYFLFSAIFTGYLWAGTLTMFVILRVLHGFTFGTVTVSGNTMVIDIMPSSRRGEGLGYYGLANNIAMSIGPMTGLFMHDYYNYSTIFLCALASCAAGFVMANLVRAPRKQPVDCQPISLDRFFLTKGFSAGLGLLMLSIPYGMTMTYMAMFAKEIGITRGTGLFFTLMAVGTAVSRIFSGRQVDRGRITTVIASGMYVVSVCFFVIAFARDIMAWSHSVGTCIFFGLALLLGLGFGTRFPAFNTLFVNLAPNNQRGTATSTYLTSWDLGVGIGLVGGGFLGERVSWDAAFLAGACLTVVSIVFFRLRVAPHFERNKLR